MDRMIGEGGFGQVWHARREADREPVAIKILHLELVRSTDAMTRFQRELEAIKRLQHPNVVRALDHGTIPDGRPYLVLEFLEGPSLRDVLLDRGALPPHEMMEILEPLCDALAVAHDAGLVHRDVKPSNVILAKDEHGKLRPVLLDFGLVKLVDQVGPGLTSSRSMLGTPAAMAPEQMRGQPVDARTDVYALGLLVYHMLTGQPAFGGAPGVVQSYLQVHGARPRPSSKVDIDPAIDEPVARALAPDPAARFEGARGLYQALSAVIFPSDEAEIDVLVLYVEASADVIEQAKTLITRLGMTMALTASDSVLAVAPRGELDIAALRTQLAELAQSAKGIALGMSRASIGHVVSGEALDVESWAPYPLQQGLWVADSI
ncbi:MAG TPA: serine/threonine-protein kinase [Kofleriaceae bacterium]|nr:serine/threonine-protein kinase [Kofleriaceae bacterium]